MRRLLCLLVCLADLAAPLSGQDRGPLYLIGRTPDGASYSCSPSTSGTRVPPNSSITDNACAVWTSNAGVILRNGVDTAGRGTVILWFANAIYVLGPDANWYSWTAAGGYINIGPIDPETGGGGSGLIYYTSTTGNDSRTCATATMLATPLHTIGAGIACLAAGDTLFVRAGTYDEVISSIPSGTSWSNKVRIAAYPGDTVWMKPSTDANHAGYVIWFDGPYHYIEFDGINVDGTTAGSYVLWVSTNNGKDPHHIRFQNAEAIAGARGVAGAFSLGEHTLIGATGSNELINVTIHGGGLPGGCGFECAGYGVYVKGPNNLIENCNIYDTSGGGIVVYNSSGDSPDNTIIRNNRIHDISRSGNPSEEYGILAYAGVNTQIYNNVIWNISGGNSANDGGIILGDNNTQVWNNTVYNSAHTGIYVFNSSGLGADVRNNIAYANADGNYTSTGMGTIVQNHNLFGVNPAFVNAGASDFHIQTSSQAKNTGVTIAGVPTDKDGVMRPQGSAYDIGAYEFVSLGGLIQPGTLILDGEFKLPPGAVGNSANGFDYGGFAMSYNPTNNSLYLACSGADTVPMMAEVNIPATIIDSNSLGALTTATTRNGCTDMVGAHYLNGPTGNQQYGGSMHYATRLLLSMFLYYDGCGCQETSHFAVNPAFGTFPWVSGPLQIGAVGMVPNYANAGYVGGYMTPIPTPWQTPLGGKALVGMNDTPIIARTSRAPVAVIVADPNDIGVTDPPPATALMYQNGDHPALLENAGAITLASETRAVVFPDGYNSILYLGRGGTASNGNGSCYGFGTYIETSNGHTSGDFVTIADNLSFVPDGSGDQYCHDLIIVSKGPHTYPYKFHIWAYDAAAIANVKAGTINPATHVSWKPWEILPYAQWDLDWSRFVTDVEVLTGAAWDPGTKRLFIGIGKANVHAPIIAVYHLP